MQRNVERSCILTELSKDEFLIKLMKENRLTSIHSTEPTLNDIFIELSGAQL